MTIKSIGINEKRGKALEKKAVELIVKSKKTIKESEIVLYIIDTMLDRIDIDQNGLYIRDDAEIKINGK